MDRPFVFRDKAGEWRWRVVAPNERVIAASSEAFATKESARRNLIRCGFLDEDSDQTELPPTPEDAVGEIPENE